MRDVLHASGAVRFGPEAQFFGGTRRFGVYTRRGLAGCFPPNDGSMATSNARKLLTDVLAGSSGPWRAVYWRGVAERAGTDEFINAFLQTPRRARDLFELGMAVQARGLIGGDKTPDNLWRAERLLDWFPQSRVIHMIRDPRASYSSMLRKGWLGPTRIGLPDTRSLRLIVGSATAIDVAANWRRAMTEDRRLNAGFPGRFLTCRFEDLVNGPGTQVAKVAKFLGVQERPAMLERSVIASSYLDRGTPGFRSEAIDAWRQDLEPWLTGVVESRAGRELQRRGYARHVSQPSRV